MTKEEKLKKIKELQDNENYTLVESKKFTLEKIQEIELPKGDTGKDGKDGQDGYTPIKGQDYYTEAEINFIIEYIQSKVKDGEKGDKGDNGKDGKNGQTPIRGIDFWTPQDQEKILQSVLIKIPKPINGISPKTEDIINEVVNQLKQNPPHLKDIQGTKELIEFLKKGGFRGGGSSGGGGSTSPLTTKGDIWGYSTINDRIPIGTNGQVLVADSTQALGLKWASTIPGEGTVTDVLGTTNRITSTGGTTPVIDISASYVGQSSITTVGTLTNLTVTNAPTFSAMTLGSVLFAGTAGLLSQDNSNFFWDNTNKRLGIGTATPSAMITLYGSNSSTILATGGGIFQSIVNADQTDGNFSSLSYRMLNSSGTEVTGTRISGVFTAHAAGAESADLAFLTRNAGTVSEKMRIQANGNVGIGITNPSATLHVVSMNDGTTNNSAMYLSANSATTGTGFYATSSTISSGKLLDLQIGGTLNALTNQTALNILTTGTTSGSPITYGAQISNTHSIFIGSTPTNIGLYLNASGATNNYALIVNAGNVGINTTAPTARLHIAAGTATAGTSPLKFTSGTLLTSPEIGAVEFLTDKFYGTITTGTARKEFTLNDSTLTSGRVPFATNNGRLTDSSALTFSAGSLTATTFVGALTGNASTATALQTARTIGGVSFDGTANIKVGPLNSTNINATTSAELAGVISDETGTGALVFGTTPTFTTSALFPNGTVANPAISFSGDTDTGFYHTTANEIQVGSGGTRLFSFKLDANGEPTISYTSDAFSGFNFERNTGSGFAHTLRFLDGWTNTWTDGTVNTYFQTGASSGAGSFSAAYGTLYPRLAFLTSKFQISDNTSSNPTPVKFFEIVSSGLARFSVSTGGDVNIIGTAARSYSMDRHTTANTAGNDFTLSSGGATTGGTNKAGGNLVLNSGISTGTGTSDIIFSTYPGTAGATTDNTLTERVRILGLNGTTVHSAPVRLKGYTVATLPAGTQGDTAFCTDLLAPGFLVVAVGGGAVVGPVFYNGAAWVAY